MKNKRKCCIFIKFVMFISLSCFLFTVLNNIFTTYKKFKNANYYDVDLN